MTISEFVRLLSKVRRVRRGEWAALCPAHPDRHPSLSVKEGRGGRILLYCQSHHCSSEDICRALGVKLHDLFADTDLSPADRARLAETRRRPEAFSLQESAARRSQQRRERALAAAADMLFGKLLTAEGKPEADALAQLWHKALDKMREAQEKIQPTGRVGL